ncbi:cytochrome P450 3A41-like [Dermacentor variabilis]|uniref:cytochrome P450 3A41-like n=1 Tax=Dermacentor variabilis TaxID=34621 RepID=UPI003F5B3D4E
MASVTADWCALVSVAIVAVAVAALWRWRRNRFNIFKDRGIPGPEPSLISGNFYQLWHRETIKVLNEWSKTYGDIYGMFNGDAPFLMVKDLELLRRVFIKDFGKFVDRGEVWTMVGSRSEQRNSLSFAKADRWKFVRRFVSMAFTSAKLRRMVSIMNKAVDRFLDLLEARCREAADGQANVSPLLGALAFELTAETACGIYLDVQNKPNDQYFNSARSYVLNVVESAYQRAGQFFSGVKSLVAFTCFLERYFGNEPLTALAKKAEPIVATRNKDPSLARPDLLQTLLEAKVPEELLKRREFRERTNDKGDFLMPLKDVACNAATVMTAGYETVSSNASNCVFCLAKYPEVQEKVRKEADAAYEKHGEFSYDAVGDLPYTMQVISEALRLYSPVVAFTSRQAACDYSYKDMILPKGLSIMACTQQIHMDPRYWDRPEEFDPDRFSPEQKASRDPLAFQPFGIGPRNCVGMKLAQLEIALIVANLVHRFRLHLGSRHENGELELKTQSIIASPKIGVWVSVEKIR